MTAERNTHESRQVPRILIAGIGNIFLGDDGFGVEVLRQLGQRALPAGVRAVDFGIRGIDLTYALMEDNQAVILVDAMPGGGEPGTLYVFEPEPRPLDPSDTEVPTLQGHNLDPAKVLMLVKTLGGSVKRLLVVGCEPMPLESEHDLLDGLSRPVAAAVPRAVELVESLVKRIQQGTPIEEASLVHT